MISISACFSPVWLTQPSFFQAFAHACIIMNDMYECMTCLPEQISLALPGLPLAAFPTEFFWAAGFEQNVDPKACDACVDTHKLNLMLSVCGFSVG